MDKFATCYYFAMYIALPDDDFPFTIMPKL